MFRFSLAALVSAAHAVSDETSLMQGLKPTQDATKPSQDKSKAISNLLSTATTMLKNGATPDVVDFAQATLTEITSVVLPAINDAHATDQGLVDDTFAMFETALVALETGIVEIKQLNDEERYHSVAHKACRAEEEQVCYTKRECDYDLYAIWKRFEEEETLMRQYSTHVNSHWCAPDVNGTLQIFRDGAITLFPPFITQKPVVERWEVDFRVKRPDCHTKYGLLDTKTALCDTSQGHLEDAACAHGQKVHVIRQEFSEAWRDALAAYQAVVSEVHCLELDRWKEWRTLSTVQCLLDRTTERNGRPCEEVTDEVVTEVARCEGLHTNTSIDHLRIVYPRIPEIPVTCVAAPWDPDMANPGRCIPQTPHTPCNPGFIAQEYAELWTPPQPEFYAGIDFETGNSHCNQRPECVMCEIEPELEICVFIMDGHANDNFVIPEPEHECHYATRAQIEAGLYGEFAPDIQPHTVTIEPMPLD